MMRVDNNMKCASLTQRRFKSDHSRESLQAQTRNVNNNIQVHNNSLFYYGYKPHNVYVITWILDALIHATSARNSYFKCALLGTLCQLLFMCDTQSN